MKVISKYIFLLFISGKFVNDNHILCAQEVETRIHKNGEFSASIFYKSIDLFNVIVFILATDHVITMLCHVTNYCGWQKHFRFY